MGSRKEGEMSDRRLVSAVVCTLLAGLLASFPREARATQKWGPLQLSGNLQTENLVRTPDASHYEFIMNRNTTHIQLDYDWLTGGKFYNKYDIPFIESSHLFLLYRGVYDSVYDTTPGFIQKSDIRGKIYTVDGVHLLNYFDYAMALKGCSTHPGPGCFKSNTFELSGLDQNTRDALKFENRMREAYADVKFRGVPLTVRAGRQQVVWGETDNFRMLDRANALDLTWHLQQEIPAPAFGWDEIRQPFWMVKFLYDLGDIASLSQNFLEWYWNPDWRPAKQSFLPRPWGLPLLDPLRNPVDGAFNNGVCAAVPGKPGVQNAGQCNQLMNGTKLFERADWGHGFFDNNQFGIRYHGIAPFGMEFTLDYFYQRWAGDDGTNFAQLRGLPNTAHNQQVRDQQLIPNAIFPAEYIAPYVHTAGLSANYSDETFTQTVFRMETVYDVGIPFYDISRVTVVNSPSLPGITSKNMWKGMIAFDRPTWIKTLNKKSTIFLTGQFFWHYLPSNPSCKFSPEEINTFQTDPNDSTRRIDHQGHVVPSCLVGGLDLPSSATRAHVLRDKIRDWETLATFAAFTFYRGGSLVPVLGLAVDTTNQFNMEPFWDLDFVARDDLVLNIGQRYFVNPRGNHTPQFETWGLAGLNRGRSETSLRLTYQF
jgi:hypothetical protein